MPPGKSVLVRGRKRTSVSSTARCPPPGESGTVSDNCTQSVGAVSLQSCSIRPLIDDSPAKRFEGETAIQRFEALLLGGHSVNAQQTTLPPESELCSIGSFVHQIKRVFGAFSTTGLICTGDSDTSQRIVVHFDWASSSLTLCGQDSSLDVSKCSEPHLPLIPELEEDNTTWWRIRQALHAVEHALSHGAKITLETQSTPRDVDIHMFHFLAQVKRWLCKSGEWVEYEIPAPRREWVVLRYDATALRGRGMLVAKFPRSPARRGKQTTFYNDMLHYTESLAAVPFPPELCVENSYACRRIFPLFSEDRAVRRSSMLQSLVDWSMTAQSSALSHFRQRLQSTRVIYYMSDARETYAGLQQAFDSFIRSTLSDLEEFEIKTVSFRPGDTMPTYQSGSIVVGYLNVLEQLVSHHTINIFRDVCLVYFNTEHFMQRSYVTSYTSEIYLASSLLLEYDPVSYDYLVAKGHRALFIPAMWGCKMPPFPGRGKRNYVFECGHKRQTSQHLCRKVRLVSKGHIKVKEYNSLSEEGLYQLLNARGCSAHNSVLLARLARVSILKTPPPALQYTPSVNPFSASVFAETSIEAWNADDVVSAFRVNRNEVMPIIRDSYNTMRQVCSNALKELFKPHPDMVVFIFHEEHMDDVFLRLALQNIKEVCAHTRAKITCIVTLVHTKTSVCLSEERETASRTALAWDAMGCLDSRDHSTRMSLQTVYEAGGVESSSRKIFAFQSNLCIEWDKLLRSGSLPPNISLLQEHLTPLLRSGTLPLPDFVSCLEDKTTEYVVANYDTELERICSVPDKCVYTCITGGYEGKRVLLDNSKVSLPAPLLFTCVTNNAEVATLARSKNCLAIIVYVSARSDVNAHKRYQRKVKACPHLFLPESVRRSLYVDGNVVAPRSKIDQYVSKLDDMIAGRAVISFAHPDRNNIHDEALAICRLKLETPLAATSVLGIISAEGLNPRTIPLTETNVLYRDHDNAALRKASAEWARLLDVCLRDQLIFDFVLQKHLVSNRMLPFAKKHLKKYPHVNPIRRFAK